MSKLAAALVAATLAFTGPAFAQEPSIVLRVDAGSALTSTGGEFTSAGTGEPLVVGEKVLINEGSKAAVVYDDGCEIKFDKPGVYEVPGDCKKGAWVTDAKSNTNTWVVVGAALLGAALISGGDSSDPEPPPPPLSTGAR